MKATFTKQIVATLGLCIALTACSEKKHETVSDKLYITAERSMDAETLSLAGEQLLTPFTFMLADTVFTMALTKDPTNQRAQFYKTFLKSTMTLKGVLNRLRPFVQTYGDTQKYDQWLLQLPNSPAKDWLLDGPADLHTEDNLQDLIVLFRNAATEFRNYLKQNVNLNLTVNINPYLFIQDFQAQTARNCVVVKNDPASGSLQVVCDYREILQRKINAADMIALSQLAASEILYLTLYSAYTAEGVAQLAKIDPYGKMPPAEGQAFLEKYANFGKLRSDNNLSVIAELGADLVAAWKWAMQNQNLACPNGGKSAVGQRPGYVFERGYCAADMGFPVPPVVAILEGALRGTIVGTIESPKHGPRQTLVDVFALTRNPVQDLRQLFPASYNSCGKANSLRDKTLGGLFPNGDAEYILDTRCYKGNNFAPIVYR